MICNDCGKETNKIYSNNRFSKNKLCRSCYQRLCILKEKYIPYNLLSEEQRHKIDLNRKNNSTYNKRKVKDNDKSLSNKNISLKAKIKLNKLQENIENNIKEAFKKVNLDDKVIIDNDYKELRSILDIIIILQDNSNKEKINKEREILRKKVEVLDKYIIDILHDLESIEEDNEEEQLLAAKKLSTIRKIRREIKNKEETLKLGLKFRKLVSGPSDQLESFKKEVNNFLRATEGKIYNRMVENPKNDNKLLGIKRYSLECNIISNQVQDRSIVKVREIITSTSPEQAKENFISILRNRYGDSVIWDNIKIERLK